MTSSFAEPRFLLFPRTTADIIHPKLMQDARMSDPDIDKLLTAARECQEAVRGVSAQGQ